MGRKAPGKQATLSAPPYQQTFASGAAPGDLTSFVALAGPPAVKQYQNACSGMIVIPNAGAVTVAWKDCNGTVNTFTLAAATVGSHIPLPVAAISLDTVTGCSVVVYWHAGSSPNS